MYWILFTLLIFAQCATVSSQTVSLSFATCDAETILESDQNQDGTLDLQEYLGLLGKLGNPECDIQRAYDHGTLFKNSWNILQCLDPNGGDLEATEVCNDHLDLDTSDEQKNKICAFLGRSVFVECKAYSTGAPVEEENNVAESYRSPPEQQPVAESYRSPPEQQPVVMPTEATQPVEPAEQTEAAEPAEPTQPTQPMEPTEPTESTGTSVETAHETENLEGSGSDSKESEKAQDGAVKIVAALIIGLCLGIMGFFGYRIMKRMNLNCTAEQQPEETPEKEDVDLEAANCTNIPVQCNSGPSKLDCDTSKARSDTTKKPRRKKKKSKSLDEIPSDSCRTADISDTEESTRIEDLSDYGSEVRRTSRKPKSLLGRDDDTSGRDDDDINIFGDTVTKR